MNIEEIKEDKEILSSSIKSLIQGFIDKHDTIPQIRIDVKREKYYVEDSDKPVDKITLIDVETSIII